MDRVKVVERTADVKLVEEAGLTRLKATIARSTIFQMERSKLGLPGEGTVRVYRSEEALRQAIPSFSAAPLMLGHHDVTEDSPWMAGYPVGGAREEGDGVIGIDYILTSRKAIEDYRSGRATELSPAYEYLPQKVDESGRDYDYVMSEIHVDHVAQVERGLNGPSIRLYEELDMSDDVTLSEESTKSLATAIGEALKGLFKRQEGGEPGNEPKVRTSEEQEAELAKVKALYKDKELVSPLLETDKARKAVRESEDSVEVLAIALNIKRSEAESMDVAVLRGRAEERVKTKEENRQLEDWDTINQTGPVSTRESREGVASFYKQQQWFAANPGKIPVEDGRAS